MYSIEMLPEAIKFIDALEKKMKAKALKTIDLLKEFVPYLRAPHSKKIKNVKNLFELRVQQGNNIARVFYFHYQSKFYLLTSGFIKKKNKTDMKEIEKAEKIMKLYLEEKGNA